MYTETLGLWAFLVFLIGAFFALYMTLIVSTAANTTLFLDSFAILGLRRLDDPATRERWRKGLVTGLPILQLSRNWIRAWHPGGLPIGPCGQAVSPSPPSRSSASSPRSREGQAGEREMAIGVDGGAGVQ